MIVVDASAILELLLRTPASETVARRLFGAGETWHAPHIIDIEVAQVLRRYAAAREIDGQRGGQALADLQEMPLTRYPHTELLASIWRLRGNVTAYDGAYIALAEALGAPLVTRDERLARVTGVAAEIEAI